MTAITEIILFASDNRSLNCIWSQA